MERFDAIIIGAGAAGMFCSVPGQAGRRVLLIDNGKNRAQNPYGSGGGRCNFTNL